MICLKRYFFLLVFALFGSFFISSSLNVNDTFAVSDLTHNFSDCSSYPYCYGSGVNLFSQGYRYLTVYFENLSYSEYLSFQLCDDSNCNSTHTLSIPAFSHTFLVALDSFHARRFHFSNNAGFSSYFSVSESAPDLGGSSSTPSGSLSITENGTYDVTNYAEAVVDVPAQVIQGDYHDDLTSINQSILICGAILLVLYFFYCIYRMIIKSTGGKQ